MNTPNHTQINSNLSDIQNEIDTNRTQCNGPSPIQLDLIYSNPLHGSIRSNIGF